MMRLLFIQETDWLKRNPLQHHHLAEMLSLRGHEIRVIDYEFLWKIHGKRELFSRRQTYENVSKVYPGAKITVVRPGIVKIPLLDYVSLVFSHRGEIERQIREFKPDVIIGLGILNGYLAAIAAKRNGIPFIYYWLDVLHWLIPFKPFQALGEFVERRTLPKVDKVVVVSDRLKEFVTNLGTLPERIAVITPGISLRQFNPGISGEAVRKQYGIKRDDLVLFFMGWLFDFFGLKEIALELARTARKNVKFLIVGEGDVFDDLRRIREEHGLQDQIILTGQRRYEEMPSFIAAADICLLAANPAAKVMHDGLPAKIFEYLAMGKPMISTRLPGVMREFGEGNGVVYVCHPEDVVDKALDIARSGEIRELGLRAREFMAGYDWEKIVVRFEEILDQAVVAKRVMLRK